MELVVSNGRKRDESYLGAVQPLLVSAGETALVRTVFDYRGDNFGGGVDILLSKVLLNGHDRFGDPEKFGMMPSNVKKNLVSEGYNGQDVLWARGLSADNFRPFMKQMSPTKNVAFLVLDGEKYLEYSPGVYVQGDVAIRRSAVIGLALVDNSSDNLGDKRISFSSSDNFLNILHSIYDHGFFQQDLL